MRIEQLRERLTTNARAETNDLARSFSKFGMDRPHDDNIVHTFPGGLDLFWLQPSHLSRFRGSDDSYAYIMGYVGEDNVIAFQIVDERRSLPNGNQIEVYSIFAVYADPNYRGKGIAYMVYEWILQQLGILRTLDFGTLTPGSLQVWKKLGAKYHLYKDTSQDFEMLNPVPITPQEVDQEIDTMNALILSTKPLV